MKDFMGDRKKEDELIKNNKMLSNKPELLKL